MTLTCDVACMLGRSLEGVGPEPSGCRPTGSHCAMPMPTTVNGRPVKTGSWTPQEDKLLADWQAKLGNRWSAVAKKISGRTGQQCAQRWRHKVNPHIKKEKWTDDEDDRLAMLVRQFGSAWAEIARRMRGRTDQQCMGRWRRHLDPSIRREAWGANEDALLVRMYAEFGSQWSRISKAVAGRTAQQCRARWFQLQPNGGPEGRIMPSGRSSARRASRRSHPDEFDEDDDDDDLGEDFDDDDDCGDEEGEGSGAGDEDGQASRLDGVTEVDDGSYDDRGRQPHILPLASPRGPNRMYAPRDKVNAFDRAPYIGRRPVPTGVIRRLPGSGYRAEPKMEGEPATPLPKSLSPLHHLPLRSQNGRQKGHSSSARPDGMQMQHRNRMADSWVSSNTVLRKNGHHQGGHFANSAAFPPWIGGNPDGDDTSAPPTPAGRTLGQRVGNPPDELSPPAMLGSPLSRQTGRRAEAQLLNGQSSPLPWSAQAAPSGERLFASPSPRKRPAPAGGSDRISPIFGGPHRSPGQYWRSSPTNSVLSLLRSPTGGPAYKADLLASPDFSALVHSPRSAEKLAAATAAGIPLPKALANLASQQGRSLFANGHPAAVQSLLHSQSVDDGDENVAGPAARCSRKVVRKLINAGPGHAAVAALAGQLSTQGDARSSEDVDTESPTKKSRSDSLSILPLQTHQPFRLQGSSTSAARPRSEQARQKFLAMMDTI
ncbi:hypothetical protein WJX84_006104 [Apatococcus fuscideae]|uniref:Uncharacterized protein n=1 Tax=Apatococcus fuscideae TaxID=2026836 RepID=A0AAW1TCM9_9CHLO